MKKIIFLFFFIMCVISCNNYPKKEHQKLFFIIGNTNDFADNTKVFLKKQENNTISLIDSTQIINDRFKFSGIIEKPSVFGIYIDSLKGQIGLFLENDSVLIDVNQNNLSKSKITGSKLNNQYLDYIKRSNQILSKTNLLYPLFQKSRAENDAEKLNEINAKMKAINAENVQFSLDYAKKYSNSYIAAFILQSLLNDESIHKDTIASIYNNFSYEVKKSDFAMETLIFIENKNKLDDIKN
ncbi:MAG TPA: hypothetical protein DEO36_04850 [Flavobacteriaceae bacterium]|nr:hypothetical protein [Flavobacteriaceae bacterium]